MNSGEKFSGKIFRQNWKRSIFGYEEYMPERETLEELTETINVKEKAREFIRSAKDGAVKAREFLAGVPENIAACNAYVEITRLAGLLKQYFAVRNKSFSLCAMRLQMCLEICSGINSQAADKYIKSSAAKREREIMRAQFRRNRQNLRDAFLNKSRNLPPLPELARGNLTRKAGVAAFLIMRSQWLIACCEEIRDVLIIGKNSASNRILNCATHLGAMTVVGLNDAETGVCDGLTAAARSLKTAAAEYIAQRKRRGAENAARRRGIFEDVKRQISLADGLTAFIGAVAKGSARCVAMFGDVYKSLFNHLAPAMGLILLVTQIASFAAKEYGIEVELNGIRAAVIASDTEYDEARDAAMALSGNAGVSAEPKYTLRIINDKGEYTDPQQLASTMLGVTDAGVTEAYDILIDGERIGTVDDPKPVVDALTERMMSVGQGTVSYISFTKEIDYEPAQRTFNAISDTQAVIDKLLGFEEKDLIYVAKAGDTLESIAKDLSLTQRELKEYNKGLDLSEIKEGEKLIYIRKDYFLPVVYSKSVQVTEYEQFRTETVDSPELYQGVTKVIQEGKPGEISEVFNVTFINGVETKRELVSKYVVKTSVTEIVGRGTFVAKPNSEKQNLNDLKAWIPKVGEAGKYIWVVNGGYISARMGDNRGHKGIDIAAPKGSEIYAAAGGKVTLAGWNSGYGNCVIVEHDDGYYTLYGHMSEILCEVGDVVQTGDILGLVGATGNATGNHLHIEVHDEKGQFLNYLDFITM